MEDLVGKKISHIYMSEDDKYIAFITDNPHEFFVYETRGECCSESWFESINNPEIIIGQVIIDVEEKEEKRGEELPYAQYIKIYGYTLKTLKGYADIEFRNRSNGYYGGYCELISDGKLIYSNESNNNIIEMNRNGFFKNIKLIEIEYK